VANLSSLSGSLTSINNTLTTKIDTLTTNFNALSWTVANINTALPSVPNASWQVKFGWRYYKSWWTTMYTFDNAVAYCGGLWAGRRLPSAWELKYIYNNKSSLSSLSLKSDYYWSDDFFRDGDYYGGVLLNMSNGSRYHDNTTYIGIYRTSYIVCLHD
jgi:hypothetical protein